MNIWGNMKNFARNTDKKHHPPSPCQLAVCLYTTIIQTASTRQYAFVCPSHTCVLFLIILLTRWTSYLWTCTIAPCWGKDDNRSSWLSSREYLSHDLFINTQRIVLTLLIYNDTELVTNLLTHRGGPGAVICHPHPHTRMNVWWKF